MSMLRSLFGPDKKTDLDDANKEIANLTKALAELTASNKALSSQVADKEDVNNKMNKRLGDTLEASEKVNAELKKLKNEKAATKKVVQDINAEAEEEKKKLTEQRQVVEKSAQALSERTRQLEAEKNQFAQEKKEHLQNSAIQAQVYADGINASNQERDQAREERNNVRRLLETSTDMLHAHSAIYHRKFGEYHRAKNELIAMLTQIQTKIIFPTGDDENLKKSHLNIRKGLTDEVNAFLRDIELEMDNEHTPATIRHVTAALQALNTDALTKGHATALYNQAHHHNYRVSNALKMIGGFLVAAFGIALAAVSMTVLGVFSKGMIPVALAAYATQTLLAGTAVGTVAGAISLVSGATLFGNTRDNASFHRCRALGDKLLNVTTHLPAPAASP